MNRIADSHPEVIYIDCTETFFSGLNTGIQRVVNELIHRTPMLGQSVGIPCIPVVGLGGRYYSLDNVQKVHGRFQKSLLRIKHCLRDHYYWARSKKKPERFSNHAHTITPQEIQKDDRFLSKVESWIRNFVGQSFSLVQRQGPLFAIRLSVSPLYLDDHVLLLVPDGFSGRYYDLNALENAFYRGVTIIPLIHDLIPITHPEVAHEENIRTYAKKLDQVLSRASGIMTVSKSVKESLEHYISKTAPKHSGLPIRFFYLGADFSPKETSETIRYQYINEVLSEIYRQRFYLLVGTIEPRKGHLTAIEAFYNLWSENFDANLVLVGRVGWKCENILREIERVSLKYNRLFFLQDLGDRELAELYSRASALILPSLTEGFGLPLVEAMHFGIPVIASDIPIFREIGGDYPLYFEVGSPSDLAVKLKVIDMADPSTKKTTTKWTSWDESALSYIQVALEIYQSSCKGA